MSTKESKVFKKTRIVHVINTDGGLKNLLMNKLIGLSERGYEVYAVSPDGKYIPDIINVGIQYHPLEICRTISPISDIKSILKFYRYLKEEKFDIIHTHTAKAGVIGRVAAYLAGVPIIIHTYHGLPFYEGQEKITHTFYLIIERVMALISSHLLSQNKGDLEILLKYNFKNAKSITYEGSGVNISLIEKKINLDKIDELRNELCVEGKKVIGFFARMELIKGYEMFFSALQELSKRNFDYISLIGGDGPLRDNLKSLSRELGIEERVKFLGWRDDIYNLIFLCDIVVSTSRKEGIPRTIMEAMTLKKPIIATNVNGTNEVVVNQITGFLIEWGDIENFADHIIKVLSDPLLAERLGQTGRSNIEQTLTEDKVIDRLDALYRKLENRIKNK